MKNENSETLDVVLQANWLILLAAGKKCSVINSKLQILLYYSQAWHLAFYRCELFREPLDAWVHGLAVFKVYKHFEPKSFLSLPCPVDLPDIPARIKNISMRFWKSIFRFQRRIWKKWSGMNSPGKMPAGDWGNGNPPERKLRFRILWIFIPEMAQTVFDFEESTGAQV